MQVKPSFSISFEFPFARGHVSHVYGLATLEHAKEIANNLWEIHAEKIEITELWKVSKHSPWEKRVHSIEE